MSENNDILNAKEVANKLKVTVRTLETWVKKEIMPKPFKIGRKLLWKESDIEEYIDGLSRK